MTSVRVSIGELLDKYSILLIKKERILDVQKLQHVYNEIDSITDEVSKYQCEDLFDELKKCNMILWDIEDALRDKERQKEFDEKFIELSRNVYKTNDQRAHIKSKINERFNSTIFEVKSYQEY